MIKKEGGTSDQKKEKSVIKKEGGMSDHRSVPNLASAGKLNLSGFQIWEVRVN